MENLTIKTRSLDPLNDFLFYKVMGEKGDEVQLLGFLNAVLGKRGKDTLTSVEILENKRTPPQSSGVSFVLPWNCIRDLIPLRTPQRGGVLNPQHE